MNYYFFCCQRTDCCILSQISRKLNVGCLTVWRSQGSRWGVQHPLIYFLLPSHYIRVIKSKRWRFKRTAIDLDHTAALICWVAISWVSTVLGHRGCPSEQTRQVVSGSLQNSTGESDFISHSFLQNFSHGKVRASWRSRLGGHCFGSLATSLDMI